MKDAQASSYNLSKCSILLGNNVSEEDGKATIDILQVEKQSFEDKYLGLPVPEGRIKDGKFQAIKERCRKTCNDWCEN
jgi:sulfite reductase beta subunit-like hemoprotein